MPAFTLPPGYSFEAPTDRQSILIGGYGLYGGADISDHYDAEGAHWVFCYASKEGDTPKFRFRAFRRRQGEASYTEQPLSTVTNGRGNADVQWHDGVAHYAAWNDKAFELGVVPGFAPFPSVPSLDARLTVVEQAAFGSDPRVTELLARVAQLEAQAGDGWQLLPAPVIAPEWEGRSLSGGVWVDVPAVFGVPARPKYLIRLVAQAPLPNVRARVGTEQAPFFVTVNTQAPGLQFHMQGWAPGPQCYVSSVNGTPTVWLQILGM